LLAPSGLPYTPVNGLFTAATNSGFSAASFGQVNYGQVNFQPNLANNAISNPSKGFVCVTCDQPPIPTTVVPTPPKPGP